MLRGLFTRIVKLHKKGTVSLTPSDIGQKIRAMRLARGLTQKELAGNFMTRNMLSMLESGKVTPSLETLCYLSDALATDPGFFLREDKDVHAVLQDSLCADMHRLYTQGQTNQAVQLFEKNPTDRADIVLLYATCCLHLGILAYRQGALLTARMYLQKGQQQTTDAWINDCIAAYLALIDAVIEEESLQIEEKNKALPFLFSLMQQCATENGEMARACNLYRDGYYREAEKIFTNCMHDQKSTADPLCQLFLLRMLESCAVRAGDFEAAYQYLTTLNRQRLQYKK